jgi:hypothetical protein
MSGSGLVSKIASHSHSVFHRSAGSVDSRRDDPELRQREKDFITEFERNAEPLSPHHIAEDPSHKKLGASSQQLRLEDFQLIKTLGTGASREL